MAGATSETAITLPDGSTIVESTRGYAQMSRLKPGVLLFVCRGYFPTSFYEPMVAEAQREIDTHGSLVLVVDGWDLSAIETGYREAWTVWFKKHKRQFRMTLLVRSKLVLMAASLANLFTGISVIATYSDILAWEIAARRDVPGFKKTVKAT
jgi:hypothetical protein